MPSSHEESPNQALTRAKWDEWKSLQQSSDEPHCFVGKEVRYADGSGSYYMPEIYTLAKFRKHMEHPLTDRTHHEYISPEDPCRLYVDIENRKETLCTDPIACERTLKRIIELLAKFYQEHFGKELLDKPMILDATRYPEKFSIHLIFSNTWFRTPMHCKRLAEAVQECAMEEDFGVIQIDLGCYWASAPRPFRLPYNWKLGDKSRYFVPRGHSPEFSWDLFLQCCVSSSFAQPENEFDINEYPDIQALSLPRAAIANSVPSWSDESDVIRLEAVVFMLRVMYGEDIRIVRKQLTGTGFRITFSPGFYCASRVRRKGCGNGYHKSHYTFITSDNWKDVYAGCPSNECKGYRMYLNTTGMMPLLDKVLL